MADNGKIIANLFTQNFGNIDDDKKYVMAYYNLCVYISNPLKFDRIKISNVLNNLEELQRMKNVSDDLKMNLNKFINLNLESSQENIRNIKMQSSKFKKEGHAVLNTVAIMFEFMGRLMSNDGGRKYYYLSTYLQNGNSSILNKYGHCKRVLDNVW